MTRPGELYDQDLTGGLLAPWLTAGSDPRDPAPPDPPGPSPERGDGWGDPAPPVDPAGSVLRTPASSKPTQGRRRPPVTAVEQPDTGDPVAPPEVTSGRPARIVAIDARVAGPPPSQRQEPTRTPTRTAPGREPQWPELPVRPDEQLPPAPAARARPPQPEAPSRPATPDPPAPAPSAPRPAIPAEARTSLGRSSAIMAAGTALSRLTGFARVIVVLAVLGVSGVDDAYNYANAVPNIVYDLLLGGILSASLVPVFVEQLRHRDRDEGDRAISAILTAIAIALAAITVLLAAAAPLVIRFYLSLKGHSVAAGDERAIGTSLLRLFAPQVFFVGAIVVSTALLNARRQFGAAAFSPVVNNLIAIAAIGATDLVAHGYDVGVFRSDHRAIAVLGIGTTLGYVVQLLVQVPAMVRSGVRLRPVLNLRHPAVRRVIGLSGWLIGVVIANQISLNVILVFAGKRTGDATTYQNAYQFFQLPYALFTVSVASALTPDLAERWARRDRLGFARRMIGGLRVTLAFLVPAAVGYALLATPLIDLAVRHGQVNAAGAHRLGATLVAFVIGLPGFSAFVLLMRAYQAMQDTRTMFKMYAVENLLSLVATYPLYQAMGVRGLALAWSLPYTVVAVVAAVHLRRRVGSLGGSLTVRALWRVVVVSAVMAVVLIGLRRVLPAGGGTVGLLGRLIVELGVGGAVYLFGCRALGIEEIQPVVSLVRRVVARASPSSRRSGD